MSSFCCVPLPATPLFCFVLFFPPSVRNLKSVLDTVSCFFFNFEVKLYTMTLQLKYCQHVFIIWEVKHPNHLGVETFLQSPEVMHRCTPTLLLFHPPSQQTMPLQATSCPDGKMFPCKICSGAGEPKQGAHKLEMLPLQCRTCCCLTV